MSGSYVTPPNNRMAWDVDGSILIFTNSGNIPTVQSQSVMTAMNNDNGGYPYEGDGVTNPYGGKSIVLFPELRDLTAYFFCQNDPGTGGAIETSADTTTGVDGTWVNHGNKTYSGTVSPYYRTAIQALSVAGIKGIRFTDNQGGGSSIYAIHLYGTPSSGNPPGLALWEPASSSLLSAATLEMGDVARSSTHTTTFRVHNYHATQTAHGVVIGVTAPTDTSPSAVNRFAFSIGGGAYAPSLSIGDLAPGATSNVITARQVVQPDAALGLGVERIHALATSWS